MIILAFLWYGEYNGENDILTAFSKIEIAKECFLWFVTITDRIYFILFYFISK